MRSYHKAGYSAYICRFIATLGPVGYLPAPGTMGTLCAFPVVFGLQVMQGHMPSYIDMGIVMAVFIWMCGWIVSKALPLMDDTDPSEIIIDEVAGFCVTMYGFTLTPLAMILGFIYFRFFDIVKPLGISFFDRMPDAWGVMLDDLVAAVYARMLLALTLFVMGQL